MFRIPFFLLCVSVLVACAAVVPVEHSVSTEAVEPERVPQKYNVLFIMVDDLGMNDLAVNNNNQDIHTPNLDAFANEGIRFTRHYATHVCSPARAAVLTGMYPSRVGFMPSGRGISSDIVTFPDRLRAEGYTTWHLGKWHLGYQQRAAWPDRQGFDHWLGFLNQWRLAAMRDQDGNIVPAKPRYHRPWLQGDEEPGRYYEGHLENVLTDEAMRVISELNDASKPWFLNLWYYAPHTPVEPAQEFAALYPDTDSGRFRALVHQLDFNIGRLLKHLESLDLDSNTIVVVSSDNGGTGKVYPSNLPYAGGKPRLHEGALRTPLLIRWPESALNGRVLDDVVATQDLPVTVLEALGIDDDESRDGVSLLKLITDEAVVQERPLFWEAGPNSIGYSMLSADGRWRLHQPYPIWGVLPPPTLYDYLQDPTGSSPVENVPPEQLASMLEAYKRWYMDVHRVETSYSPLPSGGAVLRGRDLMRTPGNGWYTFGTAVSGDVSGVVVDQPGVWRLTKQGDRVTAKFGDHELSGRFADTATCHSVVIAGRFKRAVSQLSPKPKLALTLYLDGHPIDELKVESALIVEDPSLPTYLGGVDQLVADGYVGVPQIYNTALGPDTPYSVREFADQFCIDNPQGDSR